MESFPILIVDDEEDFAVALAERLAIRGFQVEATTSGSEALSRVRATDFRVVILDVRMPGINGVTLMSEIKLKRPDARIILVTGHGSMSDAMRGLEEGAVDYLMKPVDIEELIEKINSAARD
jgi:DNA-binding response OmpR family regulator